jgi:hypothetical protein
LSTRAEIFDAVNKVRDLFTPMAVIRTWQAKKADGLIN